MSKIMEFNKFQATGNDFIVLDNRQGAYEPTNREFWATMCHRQLGVGADGVLFVENSEKYDFKMVYLNSDGKEASMCGNGARAITQFVSMLTGNKKFSFETAVGVHESEVIAENLIRLKFNTVTDLNKYDLSGFGYKNFLFANSGVPHAVFEVDNVDNVDLIKQAPSIRYAKQFPFGTNVNFISKILPNTFSIRTYERGVEGETLSCGTGAVASAYYFANKYHVANQVKAKTKGGELIIRFDSAWKTVYLEGSSVNVYKGQYYY